MGMGILHSRLADTATEASLAITPDRNGVISTDYVLGRMMKTDFRVVDGKLQIWPEVPRQDYQSWASKYPTAAELIADVELSFEQ